MGFFSSLTGSSQRKDMKRAYADSNAYLDKATGHINTGYDQGNAAVDKYIDPMLSQEIPEQFQEYRNALGINGDEARSRVYQSYMDDPALQYANNKAMQDLERRYNAGGMMDSGASRLALARAGMEGWGNQMNRLAGLDAQSFQGRENALGRAQSAGLAGAQLSSNLATGRGSDLAGIEATRAGNRINLGNGLASSRSAGIQNLMGLGGVALRAVTPGASGASAAGNMLAGVNRLWG